MQAVQAELNARTQALANSIGGLETAQKTLSDQMAGLQSSLASIQGGMATQQSVMTNLSDLVQQLMQRMPPPPAPSLGPEAIV